MIFSPESFSIYKEITEKAIPEKEMNILHELYMDDKEQECFDRIAYHYVAGAIFAYRNSNNVEKCIKEAADLSVPSETAFAIMKTLKKILGDEDFNIEMRKVQGTENYEKVYNRLFYYLI